MGVTSGNFYRDLAEADELIDAYLRVGIWPVPAIEADEYSVPSRVVVFV